MTSGPPPPPGMTPTSVLSTPQPQQQSQTEIAFSPPSPSSPPPPPTNYSGARLSENDENRRQKLAAAAGWYTETHSLVLIPCHYPVDTQKSELTCSCGNIKCESPAKHPAVGSNFHINIDLQVRSKRDAENTWSEQPWNIAILLGPRRGVFAFDVDPRHGGLESFEKLKNDLAGIVDFDATYHYNTSGGGSHYYFKLDSDDTESWKIMLSRQLKSVFARQYHGIDYKIDKGYTIMAPSKHISGDLYTRPEDAPSDIITLSALDVQNIKSRLTTSNGRTITTNGSVFSGANSGASNYASMYEMAHAANENLGVAYGGAQGYENVIAQVVDKVPGAAARLVSYFWIHGDLPAGNVKITHERNEPMSAVIRRLAEVYFTHPKMREELRYLMQSAGVDLINTNRATVPGVPPGYMQMALTIDKLMCDPPYHTNKADKFKGIVNSSMLKALTEETD